MRICDKNEDADEGEDGLSEMESPIATMIETKTETKMRCLGFLPRALEVYE